jgi:hypothetical protein
MFPVFKLSGIPAVMEKTSERTSTGPSPAVDLFDDLVIFKI